MGTPFRSLTDIQDRGFVGFATVGILTHLLPRLLTVPAHPGVYCVLNPNIEPPMFLSKSPAGHFKGKDPTVSIAELERAWVAGSHVLYVGQTGRTLRQRVSELLKFGSGEPVGHVGGRYLWQIAESKRLLVCWRPAQSGSPDEDKAALLEEFRGTFQTLPFANLIS